MIYIENLSKKYKRYVIPINTLKSFIINYRQYKKNTENIEELEVIRNLDLHILPGETFCVIGKNGSGKSTLAKLIAGTVKPTQGNVLVKGKIVPFLELGVAFSSELSGRDNVMLNGVMLGLSRKYLHEKMESIFEFAEIKDFIDTPIKYYSSGMQMRLAFSVGMHANGDVYIFDEILAVGDANFQKKCFESFKNLMEQKKTIILITHDLGMVKKYADRALLLKNGDYILLKKEEVQNITGEDLL